MEAPEEYLSTDDWREAVLRRLQSVSKSLHDYVAQELSDYARLIPRKREQPDVESRGERRNVSETATESS